MYIELMTIHLHGDSTDFPVNLKVKKYQEGVLCEVRVKVLSKAIAGCFGVRYL